jgi:hypothetical protein
MSIQDPPALTREEVQSPQNNGWFRQKLRNSRSFRTAASALLKPIDAILDSLNGLPGVGALTEIKDSTAALLDYAQDIDDGKTD